MSLEKDWKAVLNLSGPFMNDGNSHFIDFGEFRIDMVERELLRDGEAIPLTIKAFDVLAYLVENAGHTVTKDQLMKTVWPDSFVEETNITRIIHTLRKALGEGADENQYIRTVPKRGYRFIADVTKDAAPEEEKWPSTIEETEPPSLQPEDQPPKRLPIVLLVSVASIFAAIVAVAALTYKTAPPSSASGKPLSIAVLPFRPMHSGDRDLTNDLAFANSLISGLNQSKGLRVRSLGTIRGYTDVTQDPITIGNEQLVDYVLESNYLWVNGRLQVTTNLVNVKTGLVDATMKYEAGEGDLFAAGGKVAAKILPDILSKLGLEPVTLENRGTESEVAWKSYLQGMILANKRSVEDARKAIPEFENAIQADPKWGQSYAGLAHAYNSIRINGGGDLADLCPKTQDAEDKALELDPTNGDAYILRATTVRSCFWDVAEFKANLKRAIDLSPNSATVRRYYAVNVMNMGRFQEALENLNVARDLEPTATWNEKLIGRVLYYSRDYDKAIEQSKKTKDLDPEIEQTSFIYKSYELKGDLDRAMEWFLVVESLRKDSSPADLEAWKALYIESGWQGVLRKRLERALAAERSAEKPEERANAYAEVGTLFVQLGDYDNAFPYIEKAVDKYPLFGAQIKIDPYMDPIRNDPRYAAIMARTWDRSGN